ncbi:phosphate transporter PHO1 homolog 1 isoform X2 [Olea europaea var. sylvestris]|uniref:Phosphate transporter PHO1 homolog 1 isoform X2 n=1 Tax=Olea europaea subsp. europaea TaxID=158383 RepID=A0A8S0QL85_OLEEU|nr:phosphate transporter PHO1 homolog 1 isoform X2 [Olea europaea var. sylvestris]CAA2967077.1 phosphate transporter PHO1 homolog 1 isoform X2 [Olea europaea subsp. europaea]
MVKFLKQFEGQLVPEWKEAFVDYWKLKKDLKKIHLLNNEKTENKKQTNYSSSTLVSTINKYTSLGMKQREHKVIQVHQKLAASASKEYTYETELLEQFADTDAAIEFFACLDLQLNKVNQFFRTKEKEFLESGQSLKKQIEILIELKTAVKQQRAKGPSFQDTKEEDSISGTISCDEESVKDRTEQEQGLENSTDELDKNNMQCTESPTYGELGKSMRMRKEDGKFRSLSGRIINYQGKNLRIHIPMTNPTRTFSSITYLLWDDLVNQSSKKCGPDENKLHINRMKLHHAEKMIRGAFIELYKGLGYLKTYRHLNMLAFVKIMKKFDKVTNKQVLPIYIRVVESSYFNSSDKALKLADEVEELFIKHFAEDDRRKAMKYLKPTQRKESHSMTFFIGLFTGCFLALFVGYVIMAHITGMYRPKSNTVYMETVYPVLSMFSLLFLHFFLYGCNIFMWRKTRINYSFIFELSPTEELKYRDVFLICTTSMTAVVGVLFVHLSLMSKGYSYAQVQIIPGLLVLVFLLVLVCPFNIIYNSSRFRFLSVIRNIILSPLYKVLMLDFFMADQLCSQVPMLRNLEYVACYYITGSYKTLDYGYCMRTTYYRDLAYAVSFLPYYWRAMQCARRWFDEGHKSHLVNLGKYVSAMLAAGAKVAYEKEKSVGWLCLVIVMSSAATLYQLYWDFVKDWGLLQFHSKNPWLRDELMLQRKSIYFFSMGLNFILRLAWLQTVLPYNFGSVDYRVTGLFLAALEVVRRGQWNFYRLENEHLNNAGKFRAVKTVPLPFHEMDDED